MAIISKFGLDRLLTMKVMFFAMKWLALTATVALCMVRSSRPLPSRELAVSFHEMIVWRCGSPFNVMWGLLLLIVSFSLQFNAMVPTETVRFLDQDLQTYAKQAATDDIEFFDTSANP